MTERKRKAEICRGCPEHVNKGSGILACSLLTDRCRSGRLRMPAAFLFQRLVDPKGVCPHPHGDRWWLSELNESKAIGSD